jgi:hypothetical protein
VGGGVRVFRERRLGLSVCLSVCLEVANQELSEEEMWGTSWPFLSFGSGFS